MPVAARTSSLLTENDHWKSLLLQLKRFDLFGVFLIMSVLLLFSLGLTSESTFLSKLCQLTLPLSRFRRDCLWLAQSHLHRSVYHQPRPSSLFLPVGAKAGRAPCDDSSSHHEASVLLSPVLYRVCWFGLLLENELKDPVMRLPSLCAEMFFTVTRIYPASS